MLQSQFRGSPRGLVLKLFCLTSQFTCSSGKQKGNLRVWARYTANSVSDKKRTILGDARPV